MCSFLCGNSGLKDAYLCNLCNLCLILSSLQPPTTDGPVVHNLDTLHRALAFAQVASFKRRRQRRIGPTRIMRIGGCVLLAERAAESRASQPVVMPHAGGWLSCLPFQRTTQHALPPPLRRCSLPLTDTTYNCVLGLSQRNNNHYSYHHPSPCGASLPGSFNPPSGLQDSRGGLLAL